MRNVKSLLIEVNDDFSVQGEEVSNILTQAGLGLREKRHSDLLSDTKILVIYTIKLGQDLEI